MTERVFIGVGSNIGPARQNCSHAIERLASLPAVTLVQQSSFYRSEPLGNTDQNWFVNAVVELKTELSPASIIKSLLHLEEEMGRVRKEKWGPRTIDLDLLFYGQQVLRERELTLPHPGIAERPFVLKPLMEIAPDFIHPVLEKSVKEMDSELVSDLKIQKMDSSS